MNLEELEILKISMELGEKVWNIVLKWDYFCKKTLGEQIIRAIDSVAANISEGFGRYHYQKNKHFCFYARGSLLETKTWLNKARNRNLISEEDYIVFLQTLELLHKKLNTYIKTIGKSQYDH